MQMEIISNDFTRLGVINKYTMIQYTKKSRDVGSFELKCAINEENVDLIKKDRILWIEKDVAGVIQYIKKSSESEMEVKGYTLVAMLKWRVIPTTYEAYKSVPEMFQELIELLLMTGERKIKGFSFNMNEGLNADKVRYQSTGDQLLDVFNSLGETYKLCFDIGLNMKNKSFDFTLYKGIDRTLGNKEGNNPVVFGTDYSNILSSEYVDDSQEYRNFAYVAGEGEGANRKVIEVKDSEEAIGFFRREVYIDARDLRKESKDGILSDEEYNELLEQRGTSKLSEYKSSESYEGEIREDSYTTFQFGRDYNLGDVVSVIDKNLGVQLSAEVTEVTITYSEEGYSVEPVFGFGIPTLYKKLRKGVL